MPINLQKAEFVRSAAKSGDFPRDRLPRWPLPAGQMWGKARSLTACWAGKTLPGWEQPRQDHPHQLFSH